MFVFAVALASADGATLRTDGTYYRTGRERITHHFRFYTDGTVISAATPEYDTPAKIARWFRRDWPLVAQGRYSIQRSLLQLSFHTELPGMLPKSVQQKVPAFHAYSGRVGVDHVVLRRDGRGEERKYEFAKSH